MTDMVGRAKMWLCSQMQATDLGRVLGKCQVFDILLFIVLMVLLHNVLN